MDVGVDKIDKNDVQFLKYRIVLGPTLLFPQGIHILEKHRTDCVIRHPRNLDDFVHIYSVVFSIPIIR